jgi:hypothetical protein
MTLRFCRATAALLMLLWMEHPSNAAAARELWSTEIQGLDYDLKVPHEGIATVRFWGQYIVVGIKSVPVNSYQGIPPEQVSKPLRFVDSRSGKYATPRERFEYRDEPSPLNIGCARCLVPLSAGPTADRARDDETTKRCQLVIDKGKKACRIRFAIVIKDPGETRFATLESYQSPRQKLHFIENFATEARTYDRVLLRVFSIHDGAQLFEYRFDYHETCRPGELAERVAFSADGSLLAVLRGDSKLVVFPISSAPTKP